VVGTLTVREEGRVGARLPLAFCLDPCYFPSYQREEVVHISSDSSCGTLEVAGH
jgi:hypothetical protein